MADNPVFNSLLDRMRQLHFSKNADYASDGNPYSNFEQAAQVAAGFSGVDAVFAALIGVKLARLRELTSAGKTPNNESIDDTRTDLAMYAALWASYYRPSEIPESRTGTSAPFVTNEPPNIPNGKPTYDERRSDLTPCKCGAIFTHPERCDARGTCEAARHPHFSRTP